MSQELQVMPPRPLAEPARGAPPAAEAANPLLVLHSLLRGRYRFAIPLAILMGLAASSVAYFALKPKYQSIGLIQIKPSLPRILFSNEQNNVLPMFDAFVESQVMLIRSQRVMDMAMQNRDWKALKREGKPVTLADFGENLEATHPKNSEMIQVSYIDRTPEAAVVGVRAMIEAYQKVFSENDNSGAAQRLQILEDRRTTLNAQLKALNERILAIANEFGSDKLEPIYQYKLSQLSTLESQLKALELSVAVAESQARKGPTTAPSTTAPSTQAASPAVPAELSPELIAAFDPQMRDLLRQRFEASRKVERLGLRLGDRHPDMESARADLAELDLTIQQCAQQHNQAVAAGMVRSTPSATSPSGTEDLAELQNRLARIAALHKLAKEELTEVGRKNLQIGNMRAEADDVKARLDETKVRLENINVESAVSGRVNVISTGDMPQGPYKDKRIAIAAAGGVGGAAMVFGAFALVGLLNRRFRSVFDAKAGLHQNLRLLGVLPALENQEDTDPARAAVAAHCVHQIRTALQIEVGGQGPIALTITSPSPGDGKTCLTLALGVSFAACKSRTLLIDCDVIGGGLTARLKAVRHPRLGRILRQRGAISDDQLDAALRLAERTGIRTGQALVSLGFASEAQVTSALSAQESTRVGLLDALSGEPILDCVADAGSDGLCVLPLGETRAQHLSQFSPTAIRRLLDEARKHFDVILVDSGPALGSIEASVAASETDATIVVISRGQQRPLVLKTVDYLIDRRARIAGLVFNRAELDDMESSGYSSASTRPTSRQAFAIIGKNANADRLGPFGSVVAGVQESPAPDDSSPPV